MALVITIAAVGSGWMLRARPLGMEAMFASGGKAEAAGRKLAERLSRAGEDVELEIILRDGAVAGRLPYPARRTGPAAVQSSREPPQATGQASREPPQATGQSSSEQASGS